MPIAATTAAVPAPQTATITRDGSALGTALCRFVVPLWVLAGATFKLVERNPNVLPRPVIDALKWLYGTDLFPIDTYARFLEVSLRSMIAVELMAVGLMLFVPRLARTIAILMLAVFGCVLIAEIARIFGSEFTRKGWSAFLAPCGCFGAWSPPVALTFAIDFALLLGVVLFRAGPLGRSRPVWPVSGIAGAAACVVAVGVAFGFPDRPMPVITPSDGVLGAPPPVQPTPPAPVPPTGPTITTAPAPPVEAWPALPAKLPRTVALLEKRALGKKLRELPVGPLLSQPLPATLETGRWHVIFYRKDCDHCFELMNKHFSGKLDTPTLAISVPDTGGKAYPMACKECSSTSMPKGPDYVVATPLVMTLVDGVVVGISKDVDKPGALDAVLNAGKPGVTAVDGALLLERAPANPPANGTPPAPPAASKPFPPAPAQLEGSYAPEFEKWPGQRFDAQDLALIIKRPHPIDFNQGLVCVILYRSDCDHCHDLLETHFADQLAMPTVAVVILDTDQKDALDMPCKNCKLASIPGGPIYVIQTPVLIVLKDGVVTKVLVGDEVDKEGAVEAALHPK